MPRIDLLCGPLVLVTSISLVVITTNIHALHNCPSFVAPKHGHVVCDDLIGAFCSPVCQAGYRHVSQPAKAYICNPMTKKWATYPAGYRLPWPDCIKEQPRLVASRAQVPYPVPHPHGGSLWRKIMKITSEYKNAMTTNKKPLNVAADAYRASLTNHFDQMQLGEAQKKQVVANSIRMALQKSFYKMHPVAAYGMQPKAYPSALTANSLNTHPEEHGHQVFYYVKPNFNKQAPTKRSQSMATSIAARQYQQQPYPVQWRSPQASPMAASSRASMPVYPNSTAGVFGQYYWPGRSIGDVTQAAVGFGRQTIPSTGQPSPTSLENLIPSLPLPTFQRMTSASSTAAQTTNQFQNGDAQVPSPGVDSTMKVKTIAPNAAALVATQNENKPSQSTEVSVPQAALPPTTKEQATETTPAPTEPTTTTAEATTAVTMPTTSAPVVDATTTQATTTIPTSAAQLPTQYTTNEATTTTFPMGASDVALNQSIVPSNQSSVQSETAPVDVARTDVNDNQMGSSREGSPNNSSVGPQDIQRLYDLTKLQLMEATGHAPQVPPHAGPVQPAPDAFPVARPANDGHVAPHAVGEILNASALEWNAGLIYDSTTRPTVPMTTSQLPVVMVPTTSQSTTASLASIPAAPYQIHSFDSTKVELQDMKLALEKSKQKETGKLTTKQQTILASSLGTGKHTIPSSGVEDATNVMSAMPALHQEQDPFDTEAILGSVIDNDLNSVAQSEEMAKKDLDVVEALLQKELRQRPTIAPFKKPDIVAYDVNSDVSRSKQSVLNALIASKHKMTPRKRVDVAQEANSPTYQPQYANDDQGKSRANIEPSTTQRSNNTLNLESSSLAVNPVMTTDQIDMGNNQHATGYSLLGDQNTVGTTTTASEHLPGLSNVSLPTEQHIPMQDRLTLALNTSHGQTNNHTNTKHNDKFKRDKKLRSVAQRLLKTLSFAKRLLETKGLLGTKKAAVARTGSQLTNSKKQIKQKAKTGTRKNNNNKKGSTNNKQTSRTRSRKKKRKSKQALGNQPKRQKIDKSPLPKFRG